MQTALKRLETGVTDIGQVNTELKVLTAKSESDHEKITNLETQIERLKWGLIAAFGGTILQLVIPALLK